MNRDQFVSAVLKNALTVRGYKIGCDGRGADGLCDCIGLIKGAFVIMGVSWGGGAGTNYTARHYIDNLVPFTTTMELKKGDVVLKRRAPGDSGYSLPDTYKGDPDRYDYYHIGVVVSVNPFQIVHCTTVAGGIQYDNGKKNWDVKGKLKPITDSDDKGGGQTVSVQAMVTAPNEYDVHLRAQPNKNANIIIDVKQGEIVDVLDEGAEWCKIKYQEITGYMMTQFLVPVAGDAPPEDNAGDGTGLPAEGEPYDPSDEMVTLQMPLTLLVELYSLLDQAIGKG